MTEVCLSLSTPGCGWRLVLPYCFIGFMFFSQGPLDRRQGLGEG